MEKKELEGVVAEIENGIATLHLSEEKAKDFDSVSFVELPAVGKNVSEGDVIGNIETAKSVENFKTPVSGKVIEINTALKDNPELVSQDPSGKGFFVKIQIQ
jgi:glycine cleavage system H protein